MESLPSKLVMKNSTSASMPEVWMAFQIWHDRPHVINRHISGVSPIFSRNLNKNMTPDDVYKLLKTYVLTKAMTDENLVQLFSGLDIYMDDEADNAKIKLTLRKVLTKSVNHLPWLEVTILDEEHCKATFFKLQSTQEEHAMVLSNLYTFQFLEGEIQMIDHVPESDTDSFILWLTRHVFPKIQKWADFSTDRTTSSLSLVPIDKYTLLYQSLKKKYGQRMIEIWPEHTDPLKYVYEDVGIATYILLLWEKQREEKGQPDLKQTFVDLGCGNGLLVYILSSEGHTGFGIDVRRRKIWDLYPSTTILKEGIPELEDDYATLSSFLYLVAKVDNNSQDK